MKIPDRLVGFVEYDNTEMAFEFDAHEFRINLYPSKELWKKYSRPSFAFGKHKFDYTVHEWIPEGRLEGVSSAGYRVIFSIQDDPSIYSGFLSYYVHWYFICSNGVDDECIQGFSLTGDVVNSFYSPSAVLEQTHEFDPDSSISKFTVTTTDTPARSCGLLTVTESISASIEVDAIASSALGSHEQPIFANSKLITTFSEPVTLATIIQTFQYLMRFFMFITYRGNVAFKKVDLFVLNENGKRDYRGLLVFPQTRKLETNRDASRHLILYEDLRERVTSVLLDIQSGVLSFQHVCESYDDRRSYPISRVIMVLAAFERLYGSVYGKDTDRSELYVSTKDEVVRLIDGFEKACTGKRRKYVKTLKDFVDNRDSSYASNVAFACKDCAEIMRPFITRRYKGEFNETVVDLADRIGVIRNGVAHCKLDFSLEAIHLSDIHIMEELLYAIELKHIGLSVQECQHAIGRLFKENIYFPKDSNVTAQ